MPDVTAADDLLTAADAAKIIGVHLISSIRTPYNHRRYRRGDVEALLNKSARKAAS